MLDSLVPLLYRFFYESLLQPDDDFLTRSRKFIIAFAAVISICGLYFIPTNIVFMCDNPIVPKLITNQVATVALFLGSFVCWLYAKHTRTVSDALMDMWLLGVNVSILLTVVSSTGHPWVPLFQTMAIVSVTCNTPWLRYHLVLCFVGMFQVQYNQAMEPFGLTLLVIPGEEFAVSFTSTIVRHLSASLFFVIGVCIISAVINEFNRKSESASKGLRMARDVSDKLIAYDTDGAKAILALIDHGGGGGTVDPELFAAFTQITANLERYRPHLPNYILLDEQSPNDSSTDIDVDPVRTPLSPNTSSFSSFNGSHLNDVVPFVAHPNAESTNIAFAMVRFEGPSNEMTPFVDRVHSVAHETMAAIHSFVGDTVNATWNTMRRAHQPEAKAAVFVLRLSKPPSYRDLTGTCVRTCGALSVGPATYQTAGGALQALLVHIEWMPRLQALFALATEHRCVLMCGAANSVAKFHVRARCVAVLSMSTVFEILFERDSDDDPDQEWMYRVEDLGTQDSGLGPDPVSRAVEACMRQRYPEAMELLQALDEETLAAPMVERLSRKIAKCMEENNNGEGFTDVR